MLGMFENQAHDLVPQMSPHPVYHFQGVCPSSFQPYELYIPEHFPPLTSQSGLSSKIVYIH